MEENNQHSPAINLNDRFQFTVPFFDEKLNKEGQIVITINNESFKVWGYLSWIG